MNFEEIVARMGWFVHEKSHLNEAAAALTAISDNVSEIDLGIQGNARRADMTPLIDALSHTRALVTYDGLTSLDRGAIHLNALADLIAFTGKQYLRTEAEQIGMINQLNKKLEESGL